MNSRKILFTGLILFSVAALSSCTGNRTTLESSLAAYQSYDRPAKLPQNPANVHVKVSLGRQRAYVMEGNEMLLVMPVGVGTEDTPTPSGNFTITRKQRFRRSDTHGYAWQGGDIRRTYRNKKPPGWSFKGTPMPYWCEFQPSLGFHTGWVRHHPSTDGCIRMHENLAPKFFQLVSVNTPVHIALSQPEDSTHGRIPLPPDAGPLPDHPPSFHLGDGYFSLHKTPVYQ